MKYHKNRPEKVDLPSRLEKLPANLVSKLVKQRLLQPDFPTKKVQFGGIVRTLSLEILEKNCIAFAERSKIFRLMEEVIKDGQPIEKTDMVFFTHDFQPPKRFDTGFRIYPIRIIRLTSGICTSNLEGVHYAGEKVFGDFDLSKSHELCQLANPWIRHMPRDGYFGSPLPS
jgi:hypothetical protein